MKNILLIALMIFSVNKYETQNYDLILSDENFEIRFYPSSLKAKVASGKSANGNFYKLFQFISGNNSKGEKIEMTTPVYMKSDDNFNTMEFVMPSSYDMESISKPNDKNIVVYESKAKYYACIRYGGYSNSSKFDTHSQKLIQKLSKLNITSIGDIFYVSYNSPYKVFNRRNEVMVEIKYKD
jgi:effector-binding domain-containing protein